jgi:hypothetical protein
MTLVHPSITWTDGVGAATLTSVPLTFMNWTPDVNEIGDSQVPIGDRVTHFFAYRTDNIVSFEIAQIPLADRALALRLKSHLVTGGSAVIHTEDSEGHSYTVDVAPGTVPDLQMTDSVERSYTLKLVVVNTEAGALAYTPSLHLRFGTLTLEPGTLTLEAGGDTATVTATLTDSLGAPMVGFTINGVSNDESAFTVSPSSGTSDSSGQVVFTVTPHVAGSGNVHAVAGSLIASVDVTVGGVPCPLDEDFDEADIFALEAKYASGGAVCLVSVATEAAASMDGSSLTLPSTIDHGAHGDYDITIVGPTRSSQTRELWMKFDMEVVGSAYGTGWDASHIVAPMEMGHNDFAGTIGFFIRDIYGTALDPIYSIILYSPSVGSNVDDGGTGTIPSRLPVGSHSFIVCVSLDSSTVMRGELWHNPSPGDPADSVATIARPAGSLGMDSPYLTVRGSEAAGSAVKANRWQIVCGNRASDPFGIL